MTIAWIIEISPVQGVWAATVIRRKGQRREVRGSATADTLEMACEMSAELFRHCLEWPENREYEITASLDSPAPSPQKDLK
jgi:hypothetical protein